MKNKKFLKFTVSSTSNMVWCRNGSVCRNATPCYLLFCKYKNDLSDVVKGCSKCKQFQITSPAINWESAKHVDINYNN